MPYLYAGPVPYKIAVIDAPMDHGSQRWTVDTLQDLEFIRRVVELLGCRKDFTWLDILALVENHPELKKINADIQHKSMNDVDERNSKK